MAIVDEGRAEELVGGVRAARSAAHELVGGTLARGRQRLSASHNTRKSALTRQRIMDAASQLMAERGGTDIQMSEVSARCDMSKGSLYYYFADKDELIAAIFDKSVDELVGEIAEQVARAPTAGEALGSLYAEFARRLRTTTPLALALTHQLARGPEVSMSVVTGHFGRVAHLIATQLHRAKAEGAVRADLDCEAAAVFSLGGLLATSLAMASGLESESADDVSAALMDLLTRGVSAR